MKKLLTFFLTALLAFGVGWAATVTDELTYQVLGLGTSYANFTGKTATSNAVYAGNAMKSSANAIQIRTTNNNSGIVTTASGGTVKKITVVWQLSTNQGRKLDVYGKNSAYSAATDLYSSSSQGTLLTSLEKTAATGTAYTTEYTVSGDYEYIGFRSNSGAQYITSITIVWETGGGTTVTPPTISPPGGDFATSQTVTLSHSDADAIYYTTDGSDPTTSSTLYNAPFTITSTTTVKAIAVKNGVPSTVASATFTNIGVANINAALAVTPSSQFIFTGSAVVTYQNDRYVWIRDNSGSGLIFRSSNDTGTLNNGDILDANWTATNTTYNSVPEFSNPSGVASSSNGGTVAPFDKTSTGVTSANVNEYVSFSNVTTSLDSDLGYAYVTINNNKVYFRNNFFGYISTNLAATSGGTYNIEGIVYTDNDGNVFVYMTKVTAVSPILTASPNPMTFNDSGTGNTFTVTGSNLGGDNVGLTQNGSYFTPTLSTTTGSSTDGGTFWYFTPNNGSLNGTVAMAYTGRELSASETVTLANNVASTTVTVNYQADLYIVGDFGNGWDFSTGTPMTYDATNNTYTANVTVDAGDYIVFARKYDTNNLFGTRYVFGPNSNGNWWVDSSPNPKEGTIDLNDDDPIYFNCAGTFTIEINATTGVLTVTREVANTGDFELVTNVNDLNAGDEIIFVNTGTDGSAYAMSTTQGTNNRPGTAVTVSPTLKVSPTNDTQIFTLEGSSSGWYFHTVNGDNQGYIYAASSGSNQLKTEATADDNAKATISIASDGAATIIFQGTYTRNRMRYNPNNGNPIFACYSSSSTTGNLAYIYKRTASTEPEITVNPSSLELVIPAGGSSQSGTVTVTETNTSGTTSVSKSGTGANYFTATLTNGTLTVTYNGTADQANPDVAVITLTNGTATATVNVTGYKEPLTVTITPADGHTFQGSTVTGIIESNVVGATIEYSFDGTTWQTYDANNGFTATVNTVGGTVTVYARATYNGETANAQATYTRVPQSATCTADIVFAPTTDNGNLSTWNGLKSHISDGADYVSTATVSTLITSTAYNAIRFGSGSNLGELDLTLDLTKFEGGACKLSRVVINAARYSNDTDCGLNVSTNVNTTGVTQAVTAAQTDFADYVFNFDGSEVTSISIANTTIGKRVYVRSISLEYSCGASVASPEISPATGTYYESQTVTITAESGTTIYYTTDGTTPTTSSTQYNGSFVAPYTAGGTTTITAIAVKSENGEDVVSEPATVTYTWGTPTVTIIPATSSVSTATVNVTITATPAGATIYYTTDGTTPTTSSSVYSSPFDVSLPEIGDEVTVKAIAVYNGLTSAVDEATYTRVEKIIDVNAPFFSPLQNNTYYGDQTLMIECTTPNADIHYEIYSVSGDEAPSAAYVNNPTNVSTVYTGPIAMTVGNSYYVKAIAYVGNYASTISEGWYVIKPFTQTGYVYQNLKDFNDNCPTGVTASFANPVQVVYHSTYTNNGEFAEFCYLRDNTDYACVYFGKRDTGNHRIFKMGDWIDGSQISGVTNIWERNFHIQLGTGNHEVTGWPTDSIGWSEILPEEMTCATIIAGTDSTENVWGHYVHLRNTTLRDVQDYSSSDPKHTGKINDGTEDAYYYDKFYRWSAGTCSYDGHQDVINHLGDYDQTFFTNKQNAGATFDVYGVIDYYSLYEPPFEMCPIDFLWIYKPVIFVPSNDQCDAPFTTTISVTQPEWTNIVPTIYYKTDEMEDWEEYTGQPIPVNSSTTIQTYAEIPAEKSDGTNYNDYIKSLIDTAIYVFPAVADPIITPPGETFDANVTSSVDVTVATNPDSSNGTVTYYTTDGSDPRTSETRIELTSENGTFTVSENTTVNAASCLELNGNTIWSNVVSETYEFIENDNNVYDLLKGNPVVGNIYVIINKAGNVGLSTTQNATNRGATGVMFVDNTKEQVYGNSNLETFVLEAATAGRYYFRELNGNAYLCVTTNDNPNLMSGERSSYAEAAVSVNTGVTSGVDESYPATVMMSYDGIRRYLRYYSDGRTFTTYDAATTNQDIFLYGMQVCELNPPTITPATQLVEVVNGDEHIDATVATDATSAQNGAKTVYTTDGSDPRYSSTAVEMENDTEIIGYINTTTTVRAASYIEVDGNVIWSDVVKETYTFVGVKEPIITPEGGLYVDHVTVTVTTNPLNTETGVQTYYTTDGSDPRDANNANRTLVTGDSDDFTVSTGTTVKAASCVEVNGQTVWSIVVSETYEFTTATPLNVIESDGVKNNDYVVANQLVGTWAVVKGNTKLLWAKDMSPYEANDLNPGKTDNQTDYMRNILRYQNEEWDESNWVVLDFSSLSSDPDDFVGRYIAAKSVVGKYTDDVNFTIKLARDPVDAGATDYNYTGWTENFEPVGRNYDRSYNTYVPANFMDYNQNREDEVTGFVVGAVGGPNALDHHEGDSLYFVNPKIQEVARIWGVWSGDDDSFTMYIAAKDTVGTAVSNLNAWDLKGRFEVNWTYNRTAKNGPNNYGKPSVIANKAYEFHAAIQRVSGSKSGMRRIAKADDATAASDYYVVYPLDMKREPNPTAVHEVNVPKEVVSVTYYNLMGVQSKTPFEGLNIIVTRYSDGSITSTKVLRR